MRRPAFTIIELMVTILLMGLLLSIGTLAFGQARRSNRDARRSGDVLELSRAIEQSVSTRRGIYPNNSGVDVSDPRQARMCVSELFNGSNSNAFDLTQFSGRTAPVDPQPELLVSGAAKTTNCTSYRDGYTYHTPRNGACTAANANSLAFCQKVSYTIEVGFENSRPADDTSFKSPTELPISNYSMATSQTRTAYLLNGRPCNSSCYTQ